VGGRLTAPELEIPPLSTLFYFNNEQRKLSADACCGSPQRASFNSSRKQRDLTVDVVRVWRSFHSSRRLMICRQVRVAGRQRPTTPRRTYNQFINLALRDTQCCLSRTLCTPPSARSDFLLLTRVNWGVWLGRHIC